MSTEKNEGATAPGTATDPFEVFKRVRERIETLTSPEWFSREASFLLQAISNSEQLQRTTPVSRAAALLQLANTGLTLNPLHKLCYVVSRNVKVKAQGKPDVWESRMAIEPSYMGLIKAATDTGSVKLMRAEVVYKGDHIRFLKGTSVAVEHIPYWQVGQPRGEVVAAYSVATLHDGTMDVLDMGLDELNKVMGASDSVKKNEERKSKGEQPFSTPYDTWREEMYRKAPIRRHLKTLPKTELLDRLFAVIGADEEHFGSTNAEQERQASELAAVRKVRLELSEALEYYQGADREELRSEIQAKINAREFTVEYGQRMLSEIRGLKS